MMLVLRCLILIIGLGAWALQAPAQGSGNPPVLDYAGLEPLLQQDNDTTYVVNFWATWCAPCVKELPYFERMHKEGGNAKLRVILVSLDFADKLERSLYPFMENHQLQSDVIVLDDPRAHKWIAKVHPAWSGAIPATLAFSGSERIFKEGSFADYEELKAFIQPLKNN